MRMSNSMTTTTIGHIHARVANTDINNDMIELSRAVRPRFHMRMPALMIAIRRYHILIMDMSMHRILRPVWTRCLMTMLTHRQSQSLRMRLQTVSISPHMMAISAHVNG